MRLISHRLQGTDLRAPLFALGEKEINTPIRCTFSLHCQDLRVVLAQRADSLFNFALAASSYTAFNDTEQAQFLKDL